MDGEKLVEGLSEGMFVGGLLDVGCELGAADRVENG